MPHDRRARPAQSAMLSGGTMLRVGSLIAMLVIMGITINRYRPRGVIRAVNQPGAAEQAEAAPRPVIAVAPDARPDAKPAKEPVPIERPADELEQFRHDAEAIADRSLTILPVEQKAYFQLIRWVNEEPLAALVAADPPEASFQNFVLRPEKHRAELVQLELLVRRALKVEAPEGNSAGVKTLYELWGWPANAHGRMYTIVTPDLPPGFPIGTEVEETARVFGYFFKLQGYELGSAKPYAAPQVAPLLVGRLQWAPFVSPNAEFEPGMYYALVAMLLLLVAMISFWVWTGRRKPAQLALRNATLPATAGGEDYVDSDRAEEDAYEEAPPADPFRFVQEEDEHGE
jgi:hypothetical protein